MKRTIIKILIAVVIGAAVADWGFGYTLLGYKWPTPTAEMQLGLGEPWDTAIITAGSRWSQGAGFQFTYSEAGYNPCSGETPPKNGVVFSDSVCGDSFGASTLAVTLTWTTSTPSTGNKKVALTSGILFNSAKTWAVYDGPWGLGQFAGQSDFRRVAVHELGHVIGLGHENVLEAFSIMLSSIAPGSNITFPQTVDVAGVVDLYTGSGDKEGPAVVITSPRDYPVVVGTDTVTLEGTVSDANTGGWGVSSVSVNGIEAEGGTATGMETGYWRKTMPLQLGTNILNVSARDNSANHNIGSNSIGITYKLPNGETSGLSGIYHVFPRFASGKLPDGTRYKSTLMISIPTLVLGPVQPTCTFKVYGLPANVTSTFSYTVTGRDWFFEPLDSTKDFQAGYATLSCSQSVDAEILSSLYDQAGRKISETTIFPSPPSSSVQILADNRDGARTAFSVANDSDRSVTASITISDVADAVVGTAKLSLNARSSQAKFVDELLPLPADFYGRLLVSIDGQGISIVGLRYTNGVFSAIPQTVRGGEIQLTAAKSHVFPRYADGFLNDGSYFRTTMMVSSPLGLAEDCTLSLYQQGSTQPETSTFSLGVGGWRILPLVSGETWKEGYVTLNCSGWVEAQLLYSFYGSDGVKRSEAAVISSPSAPAVEFLGDTSEGAKIAITIANDSDETVDYGLWATQKFGDEVFGSFIYGTLKIGPRSVRAAFLVEIFKEVMGPSAELGPLTGPVRITSNRRLSIIGFRYTDSVFATLPESVK